MTNFGKEGEIILPRGQNFQAVTAYKEPERMPTLVAKQTATLLGLFHQGAIHNPDLAIGYLHDYALALLGMAEKGADAVYDRTGVASEMCDPEVREVADFAYIMFAHLPDSVTSPLLPMGFSRKGMLRAPETAGEFRRRIKELKIGIWQVVEGEMPSGVPLEANPSLLRTYGFFRVGGEFPMRVQEDQGVRYRIERERFNDLLAGIDISL